MLEKLENKNETSDANISSTQKTKRRGSATRRLIGVLFLMAAFNGFSNFLKTQTDDSAEIAGSLFAVVLLLGIGIWLLIGKKITDKKES